MNPDPIKRHGAHSVLDTTLQNRERETENQRDFRAKRDFNAMHAKQAKNNK